MKAAITNAILDCRQNKRRPNTSMCAILQRLRLVLSYPVQVQHVQDLLARAPLCGDESQARAELVH